MSSISDFIESHLNETLGYEMREKYEELLYDWYGDDLSLFNPDDEDLAIAFINLRKNDLFWRTNPVLTSPYQKLRRKYDALLESYMQIVDDYKTACFEKEQLAAACRKTRRQVIALKINGGRSVFERRSGQHDRSGAA